MKWVLIAAVAVMLLVTAIVLVGLLLPRTHVAARTAAIQATPEQVWTAITDVEQHPAWRRDVRRVELLGSPEGQLRWREHRKHGAITMEEVERVPPRRWVGRIADPDLPFGGTWEYEIAASGDGSRVTITERGEVHNPVFRFMSRFVFGHTGTMDAFLRALGARFGGSSTPEPAAAASVTVVGG
ncbi:MAG TPA: SRPBCC family protein [Gemmatimonadaceae bacterium]|nr:SRPBCC family protein [Gemmatimonadaceae bacterium]